MQLCMENTDVTLTVRQSFVIICLDECMSVCMSVCIYAYICMCFCVRMYTCMCACMKPGVDARCLPLLLSKVILFFDSVFLIEPESSYSG